MAMQMCIIREVFHIGMLFLMSRRTIGIKEHIDGHRCFVQLKGNPLGVGLMSMTQDSGTFRHLEVSSPFPGLIPTASPNLELAHTL